MRWGLLAAMWAIGGCASSQLASAPPAGVDLSGRWKLNVADSDDAQRLMQSQIAAATAGVGAGGASGASRQGGRGGLPAAATGPMMPPVLVLDESLRWPGREVDIRQTSGLITFSSDGSVRNCHPDALAKDRPAPSVGRDAPRAHDAASRGRGDAPPPRCGWDQNSLVVRTGEADDDSPPFEQRFSVSPDGQRLVEVVVFRGGRSNGFVASREWERAPSVPGAAAATQAGGEPQTGGAGPRSE